MNAQQQPPASPWTRMLISVPVRNTAAKAEDNSAGCLVLRVQRDLPWFFRVPPVSWILAIQPERRMTLDRLGSWVWKLCDGNRNVEQLVDDFAAAEGLSFHEARVAVTGYLKTLIQRGALAVEVPGGK